MFVYKIINIFLDCLFLATLPCGVIGVIFFRIVMIPRIEKRLGKKLSYTTRIYKQSPLSMAIPGISEYSYIVHRYLYYKFTGRTREAENKYLAKVFANFALDAANYKIEEATKFEIFMSFFIIINLFLFFTLGGIFYLMKKYQLF